MKIGIDIRNLSTEQKKFSSEFIKYFGEKNQDALVNIYSVHEFEGVRMIKSKSFQSFLGEQVFFLKRLLEDKNDLVITFNDTFPVFYNKRFVQVITSLEKLLYPNIELSKTFKKYTYQSILKANLKKAEKIICFDEKTKKDINEKLNINEEKIEIIPGFFPQFEEQKMAIEIQIDIKQKHSFAGEYLVYDSEIGSNKNIKRLLEAIAKTNINLVFIGNQISSDIEIREMIMRLGVKEKVVFAGFPESKELSLYYKQSLGVIFPTLYTSFPFSLEKAINFKTKILSSNLEEIKDILGETAQYFSPISTLEIMECIEKNANKDKNEVNYDDILKKYSKEDFTNNLMKACQI